VRSAIDLTFCLQRLSGAGVIGVVEGGFCLEERLRSAKQTGQRPVSGRSTCTDVTHASLQGLWLIGNCYNWLARLCGCFIFRVGSSGDVWSFLFRVKFRQVFASIHNGLTALWRFINFVLLLLLLLLHLAVIFSWKKYFSYLSACLDQSIS